VGDAEVREARIGEIALNLVEATVTDPG